jgi:hypothetical protein
VRNTFVEIAVESLLTQVDNLIGGGTLSQAIPPKIQAILDTHVVGHGGSVRLASVFLVAYSLVDARWNFDSVPKGIRGQYGDKGLAAALTERHVTFHKSITAFGENLGWKGAVENFSLMRDVRFKKFLGEVKALRNSERKLLLEHAAWRIFESRVVPKAIPALPAEYLTYARAALLCERVIAIPSEGHIQQFLVAAFLSLHRRRSGAMVQTHHPHASDTFDRTFGDIEELREGTVTAAYEVTARPDWKNRIPDLEAKMRKAGLRRYVVIATNVTTDPELSPASSLVRYSENLRFDLAVVDIGEFFRVFCAELSTEELAEAFNLAYAFLCDPNLCGRVDFIDAFAAAVADWLQIAPKLPQSN